MARLVPGSPAPGMTQRRNQRGEGRRWEVGIHQSFEKLRLYSFSLHFFAPEKKPDINFLLRLLFDLIHTKKLATVKSLSDILSPRKILFHGSPHIPPPQCWTSAGPRTPSSCPARRMGPSTRMPLRCLGWEPIANRERRRPLALRGLIPTPH